MTRGLALGLGVLLLGAGPSAADDFVMISQNTLHYGWGGAKPTKEKALRQQFENELADVIVLQEVMNDTRLSKLVPNNGQYTILTSNLKGRGGYLEMYAFIIDDDLEPADLYDYTDSNNDFSRPPSGVMLQPQSGEPTWVLDYHAIFGKSIGVRRAEAAAMVDVVRAFEATKVNGIKTDRIVIGGDWNLPTTDKGFAALKGIGYDGAPNVLTSLTPKGQPSSAYDHFFFDSGEVTVSNEQRITPANKLWWRQNVSDHMGISCEVTY